MVRIDRVWSAYTMSLNTARVHEPEHQYRKNDVAHAWKFHGNHRLYLCVKQIIDSYDTQSNSDEHVTIY